MADRRPTKAEEKAANRLFSLFRLTRFEDVAPTFKNLVHYQTAEGGSITLTYRWEKKN